MLFASGQSGPVILFVVSLACWGAVSGYLLVVAARVYMVILQGTADGIDRVEWPDEPVYDWLLTALYFLGLSALILMPAGILSRALAGTFLPDNKPLRYLVIAGPFLWAFFPLGLLSSLSASSRWAVLSPRILLGMLLQAPMMMVFYGVTGGLFAAVGWLGYVGLFSPVWYALPLAVVALSALWMIHARLVGRLGWLIHQRQQGATGNKKRNAADGSARPRKKRARSLGASDPWGVPEGGERPAAKSGGLGYGVVEQPPEPRPPRPTYLDPEPDPYALAAVPEQVEETKIENTPPPVAQIEASRIEREVAMRRRDPPNPPPAWPLWSGVYTFPLYENCRKPLVELILWGSAWGVLFRVMFAFFPS